MERRKLEIKPEVGLGPFMLGTPIGQVLTELKVQSKVFGKTDVVFSRDDPMSPIYLNVRNSCFRLRFNPRF